LHLRSRTGGFPLLFFLSIFFSPPALPRFEPRADPHGGAGVEAGAAAVQGVRGDEVRGKARLRVPQDAHGEEQAPRRRPAHHPEVPGALQAALLHPPREVSDLFPVLDSRVPGVDWFLGC